MGKYYLVAIDNGDGVRYSVEYLTHQNDYTKLNDLAHWFDSESEAKKEIAAEQKKHPQARFFVEELEIEEEK